MPICKKCAAAYSEGAKFCSNCGNPLLSDESSISIGEDMGDLLLSQGEEGAAKRLTCPRCKILYERGSTCIRCRSPLVESGALVEGEEPKPSETVEIKKETPLLVEAPGFQMEEPNASPKQEILFEVLRNENPTDGIPKDETAKGELPSEEVLTIQPKEHPRALNRPQVVVAKNGIVRKSKIDRVLQLSFESVKILILIGTAGYLLWSISSHFFLKGPEAKVPAAKGNGNLAAAGTPIGNSVATRAQSDEGLHPQPAAQASAAGPAREADALENVRNTFEKIKEGNLAKNIELFMGCYSPSFKDREEKRRETLRTWGNFDFHDLSYDLKTCSVSGSIARATVEWRILFSQKAGGPAEESRALLSVTLEKKEDGWKILEVKSMS